MARTLVIFAHPALEKSRINARLVRDVPKLEQLTFHDLYEAYPDFHIDVAHEQQLLSAHNVIVLHHPMYWYSSPALVKQWEDLVLEHGWAYGSAGTALRGKTIVHVITTGGSSMTYDKNGLHGHTIREFLLPFEQTARLCGMLYLPPYLIQGSHRLSDEEVEEFASGYHRLLEMLAADAVDLQAALKLQSLNELVTPETNNR